MSKWNIIVTGHRAPVAEFGEHGAVDNLAAAFVDSLYAGGYVVEESHCLLHDDGSGFAVTIVGAGDIPETLLRDFGAALALAGHRVETAEARALD